MEFFEMFANHGKMIVILSVNVYIFFCFFENTRLAIFLVAIVVLLLWPSSWFQKRFFLLMLLWLPTVCYHLLYQVCYSKDFHGCQLLVLPALFSYCYFQSHMGILLMCEPFHQLPPVTGIPPCDVLFITLLLLYYGNLCGLWSLYSSLSLFMPCLVLCLHILLLYQANGFQEQCCHLALKLACKVFKDQGISD